MPIIRSAIKKMRQDHKRTVVNRAKKETLKKVLKLSEVQPTSENLGKAFSALDKAVKVGLIPKGRADRKKSRLSHQIGTTEKAKTSTKTTKTKKTSSSKQK